MASRDSDKYKIYEGLKFDKKKKDVIRTPKKIPTKNTCKGICKNGKKCEFKASEDGYCKKHHKTYDKPDDCPICMDSLNNQKESLTCGHWAHFKCLSQWMSKCPVCRSEVKLPKKYDDILKQKMEKERIERQRRVEMEDHRMVEELQRNEPRHEHVNEETLEIIDVYLHNELMQYLRSYLNTLHSLPAHYRLTFTFNIEN